MVLSERNEEIIGSFYILGGFMLTHFLSFVYVRVGLLSWPINMVLFVSLAKNQKH